MDVFALAASITLDTTEYENALGDASGKTHSFGDKLKSGLATAAKAGAAAIGAATAAVGALAKAALNSYGDYEQLTGGVETLFKTSADVVMEYANNAYKTAGLSANEYMETVTPVGIMVYRYNDYFNISGDTTNNIKQMMLDAYPWFSSITSLKYRVLFGTSGYSEVTVVNGSYGSTTMTITFDVYSASQIIPSFQAPCFLPLTLINYQ